MARNNLTDYEERPRFRRRGMHPLLALCVWGVILSVSLAGLYAGLQWLKKRDPSLGNSGGLNEPAMVRVFFLDLHQRYLDNAEQAGRRYTGKVVEIENKGDQGWDRFSRIEQQEGQTAVLCFDIDNRTQGPSESPVVLCLFPPQNAKQLAGLGKKWVIRGRVSSFDADASVVVLEECEVVP
jgi:hypothetical protein